MKKIKQVTLALLTAISILNYSCGPNDNEGSMDQKNSGGEGATDTTKIPNFDSTGVSDSSHASLSGQDIFIHTIQLYSAKITSRFLEKRRIIFYD